MALFFNLFFIFYFLWLYLGWFYENKSSDTKQGLSKGRPLIFGPQHIRCLDLGQLHMGCPTSSFYVWQLMFSTCLVVMSYCLLHRGWDAWWLYCSWHCLRSLHIMLAKESIYVVMLSAICPFLMTFRSKS